MQPRSLQSPKFHIHPSEELLRLIFESARDFAIHRSLEDGGKNRSVLGRATNPLAESGSYRWHQTRARQ